MSITSKFQKWGKIISGQACIERELEESQTRVDQYFKELFQSLSTNQQKIHRILFDHTEDSGLITKRARFLDYLVQAGREEYTKGRNGSTVEWESVNNFYNHIMTSVQLGLVGMTASSTEDAKKDAIARSIGLTKYTESFCTGHQGCQDAFKELIQTYKNTMGHEQSEQQLEIEFSLPGLQ